MNNYTIYRKFLYFLYFLFVFVFVQMVALPQAIAQPARYQAIDEHVYTTPKSTNQSAAAITNYICQPAQNDLERTRAIFTWISNNIDYDVEKLRNPARISRQSIAQTLTTQRAVCQGYSELFKEMCGIVGVPCEIVVGYSVPLGVALHKNYFNSNHAWNVVFVENKWQPLDVTWASGYIDNSGKEFEGLFNDVHFITPPHEFINTHIPEDPQWQLLNYTVTIQFINPKTTDKKLIYNALYFNFIDSIAFWRSLPNYEKELKTAINAHKFNPKNNERVAIAYYNYSTFLIKTQVSIPAYNVAYLCLQRAIEFSKPRNFDQAADLTTDCLRAQEYITEKRKKWNN